MVDQVPPASGLTRRQALRRGAALLAAPWFVPSAALGRGGRAAPSERITLGLIGLGNMGRGHLETLLGHPQVQIVAVCDVDAVKRDAARAKVDRYYADERGADRFAGCGACNEYERLLARDDVDAVLIAVPDHWHALIAIAACRAGKDVYCEKPLSLTVREAEQMVATARQYGAVFQVGSQQRSSANFRRACELVRNGRIGKVRRVLVNIGEPSAPRTFEPQPVPAGLDWDRWLGPAPWAPYNAERCSGSYSGGWRLVRDYSGGMTTDWGAHHYDIAQWGLGRDGGAPIEYIPAGHRGCEHPTCIYDDGVILQRTQEANGVRFVGDDGSIEVNRGHLRAWPDDLLASPLLPGELHLYESSDHHQNWLDCIRTRRRPICDVEIGASTITLCHLANIAHWLDRPIRWDPTARIIIGDAQANRWLDRPKRAPWGTA